MKAPEEDADTSSPSFSLGRSSLPWAPSTLSESLIARPEGADRAHGAACAKGVAASTSRGAGTSAIARSRNVAAKSASGRRPGGRPNTARLPRPKPATPKPSARAASGSRTRPRLVRNQRLRRRVVTQQKFFFRSLVRSAGLLRTPRDLTPQPGAVLLPRLPSGGSQCPGSGTQVARARHVGRSQEAGLRVPSRALAPVSAAM
jgi:hypothetical protein